MSKMTQDAKKDEFRKYLEKAGVLELLTKSLVQLYEEPDKPQDALAYLKNSVGGSQDDKTVIAKLKEENEQLKQKCKEIEAEKIKLEKRVKELQEGGKEAEETDKSNDKEEEKSVPATESVPVSSDAAEVEANTSGGKSGQEPAPVSETPTTEEPMETEATAETASAAETSDTSAKPAEKEAESAEAPATAE